MSGLWKVYLEGEACSSFTPNISSYRHQTGGVAELRVSCASSILGADTDCSLLPLLQYHNITDVCYVNDQTSFDSHGDHGDCSLSFGLPT